MHDVSNNKVPVQVEVNSPPKGMRLQQIVMWMMIVLYAHIADAQVFDLDGFEPWSACVTGPVTKGSVTPGCSMFDVDGDDDIDLADFAKIQRLFVSGSFVADQCVDVENIVGTGFFAFDNTLATNDGPAHLDCKFFDRDQIDHDLWGCWTSSCSGTTFVDTCGATGIDTKVAVYEGCDCPVTDSNLLSCNDDACDVQSFTAFEAGTGQRYLIRVGTYPGNPGGVGTVKISCDLKHCPGSGDCFAIHNTPGCADQDCCETTCTRDPFCCSSEWDEVCVEEALGLCAGSFTACGVGTGSCLDVHTTPGCDDIEYCNRICQIDPFCCLDEWDEQCTEGEASICFGNCVSGSGDCLTAQESPGCQIEMCCAIVCPNDPFCCQVVWDQTCADEASGLCP